MDEEGCTYNKPLEENFREKKRRRNTFDVNFYDSHIFGVFHLTCCAQLGDRIFPGATAVLLISAQSDHCLSVDLVTNDNFPSAHCGNNLVGQ